MSAIVDLKTAERKAYQLSTSQDGLCDVSVGAYILLLSAVPWLDENALPTPWNVILAMMLGLLILSVVILIQKFIVVPRMGRVRFGVERKNRLKRLSIGMAILFLLTLVLFARTVSAIYLREPTLTSASEGPWHLDLVHTAAGVFIFAIFSVIGYVNDYVRMYFYGFLLGLGYVISTVLQDLSGIQFYWPWAVAGLVAVVTGLVFFVRFLREYSPQPE